MKNYTSGYLISIWIESKYNFKGILMQIWKSRPYIQIHIKIIPWQFRIVNRKISPVIHLYSLYFS